MKTSSACIATLLLLGSLAARAHEPDRPPPSRVLGELSFPTASKVAPARAAFLEGMLFLHLFEYRSAELAFQRAQRLDPGMAMAYWGEAATYTHPIWNQQDVDAGRAALAKLAPTPAARAAKAADARERAFLSLAEAWYGEGDKPARDAAALAAAEALAKAFPQDHEAQLQLSLALLGANQGNRDLPRFLRAAEIARAVFARNPKHPGAAHYWIHGMDDPEHAAGALEAAHALSKIAPDAGHSQHMTSHIFVALGRWQDVVDANVAAMRVVNEGVRKAGQPEYRCGHYAEWLQYAWLQQGREAEATQLLSDCVASGTPILSWMRAHPGEAYISALTPERFEDNYLGSLARMRAMALVDSPSQRAAQLAVPAPATAVDRRDAGLLLARGLAQVQAGATQDAANALAALQRLAEPPKGVQANDDERQLVQVMAQMLEAAIEARAGRGDEAVRKLAAAADAYDTRPVEFGPPSTVKPPRELLGELLLAQGRKDEAAAQFELALKAAPRRAASLRGLERSRVAAAP